MQYQYHNFPNGLRLVHLNIPSPVAHAGVIIDTGSRYESKNELGIAHTIEHCIFKGTKKRNSYRIITRLEDVGGELNAYTAKEETFVYASFLSHFYDRTLELISDLLFNPVFPEKEIEKEKIVILDEINSYKDNPYEMIHEHFDELMFPAHPLGHSILGKNSTVKKLSPEDLHQFIKKYYKPSNMIVCSVGNIDFKKLIKISEKYFFSGKESPTTQPNPSPLLFSGNQNAPFFKTINRRHHQSHCVIGTYTYGHHDEKRLAFAILNNILGGPAMSSRLNLAIREKYGHAYHVESNFSPYQEIGLSTVYLASDNKYMEKTISLAHEEIRKLCDNRLSPIQLGKAKQQMLGQIAISFESNLNHMLSMGKSMMVYQKIDTFEEIRRKIEQADASMLQDVARETWDPAMLNTLIYQNQ